MHDINTSIDPQECPWLLRSPVTSEYDLLSVTGDWTVWAGELLLDLNVRPMFNYSTFGFASRVL